MKNYDGKNVFVVGGSSGIGLASAIEFARQGAHVIIFARGAKRLKSAVKEIAKNAVSEDQRFLEMTMDVSRKDEVKKILRGAVENFGPPDVLINSAGRAYPNYFEKIGYDQFDETMKINLYGVWNTTAVLVPYMKKRGGHIVNVSSIAGFLGVFGYTDYSASKFAIIGFSEALRSELKRYGICVSVLCPPDTDTPALKVENRTKPKETKAVSGGAKLMQPENVARALVAGMKKEKLMIIPGFDGKSIFFLKRFFPGLAELIMDAIVRKAQKKKKKK
jgi:short-subunit dehydrogenase